MTLETLIDYFEERKNLTSTYLMHHRKKEDYENALPAFLAEHHFFRITNNGSNSNNSNNKYNHIYARQLGEKTAVVLVSNRTSYVAIDTEATLCYAEIPTGMYPVVVQDAYHAYYHHSGGLSWLQAGGVSLVGASAGISSYILGGQPTFYGVIATLCGAILFSDMNHLRGVESYRTLKPLEDSKAVNAIVESDKKVVKVLAHCLENQTTMALTTLLREASFKKFHSDIWVKQEDKRTLVAVVDKEFHLLSLPCAGEQAIKYIASYASLVTQKKDFVWPFTVGMGIGTSALLTIAFLPVFGPLSLPLTLSMGTILAAYFAKDQTEWNNELNQKALKDIYGSFEQRTGKEAVAFVLSGINSK